MGGIPELPENFEGNDIPLAYLASTTWLINKEEIVNQTSGGSVWESKPPKTLLVPSDGFEVVLVWVGLRPSAS